MKDRENEVEQLRGEIAKRPSRRGRLSGEVRARCAKYAAVRTAEGASKMEIAGELAVSETSVQRWLQPRSKGRLVPVQVKSSPERKVTTSGVVVTTARGLRIEGLDLDALCILLAKLG